MRRVVVPSGIPFVVALSPCTRPDLIAAELRRYMVTLPQADDGVAKLLAAVDASCQEAGMFTPEWAGAVRKLVA